MPYFYLFLLNLLFLFTVVGLFAFYVWAFVLNDGIDLMEQCFDLVTVGLRRLWRDFWGDRTGRLADTARRGNTRLVIRTPAHADVEVTLQTVRVTIGRSQNINKYDIIIRDDPLVSRPHARLEYDGEAWQIRDLGSRNGTLVQDARSKEHWLHKGETRRLLESDAIKVGQTWLWFVKSAG